jgi:hypothetical protein
VIHLYAFARGLRALPVLPGVRGGRLSQRAFGYVTAVVGSVDRPCETREDALRHGLVVEALVDCADAVLPVRLGPPLDDEQALEDTVRPRLPALADRLARVAGCVEIGVRMACERDEAPPSGDGAGYLRARLAAWTRENAAAAGLHRALEGRARDCVVTSGALGARRDAGYLVPRGEVDGFAAEVERYVAAHPELTVVCTGPWAPYSFAGGV